MSDVSSASSVWTIDQLTERAAAALADGDGYPGQSSGRVREVPNIRTVRWYTTIGLLDRPAAMRGRTALYGRRHLAQIVAIKRLQAEGRSLSEVQEALIGADDATLYRIAGMPAPEGLREAAGADAFDAADGLDATDPTAAAGLPEAPRARFWAAAPASRPASPPAGAARSLPAPSGSAQPESAPHPTPHPTTPRPTTPPAPLVHGVQLAADVTLLLTGSARTPGPAERRAIEEAAGPLLDLLHRLGLTDH